MKKVFISVIIGLLVLGSFCTVAMARGRLTVKPSLSAMKAQCTVSTTVAENLSVSFTLYKVENGKSVFVCSASAIGNATNVTASKNGSYAAGTYKMVVSASGSTASLGSTYTFTL